MTLEAQAAPAKHGLAPEFSPQGELIGSWYDLEGKLYGVTTAASHNGYLYLGTAPGGSKGVYVCF
ncbi:hypothetical protein [Paenibacillus sp. BAC0078]